MDHFKARTFEVGEIARFFGIPWHLIDWRNGYQRMRDRQRGWARYVWILARRRRTRRQRRARRLARERAA